MLDGILLRKAVDIILLRNGFRYEDLQNLPDREVPLYLIVIQAMAELGREDA